MLQRVVQHEEGRFTACNRCGAKPRHVAARGRSITEPVRFAPSGERQAVKCTADQCGNTTAFHPSLAEAEAEWRSFPQLALRLIAPQHPRQVAA